MKTIEETAAPTMRDDAKSRLLSVKGDPFVFADWERVLFLNFAIEPAMLRPHVPAPFELQLFEGAACVSLAAVTMRRFRPCRRATLAAWPLGLIRQQRFLNVRTYVQCGDESGVLFLWGFLSRPVATPMPSELFGLPYTFALLDYGNGHECGELHGLAICSSFPGRFAYHARIDPHGTFEPCPAGSMDEFAMERYTGFFCRGRSGYVFRAWHPPWLQTPVDVRLDDLSLINAAFPWFGGAKLMGANYALGFERVWLGRAHRLMHQHPPRRKTLSTFFELP